MSMFIGTESVNNTGLSIRDIVRTKKYTPLENSTISEEYGTLELVIHFYNPVDYKMLEQIYNIYTKDVGYNRLFNVLEFRLGYNDNIYVNLNNRYWSNNLHDVINDIELMLYDNKYESFEDNLDSINSIINNYNKIVVIA